jgi:peptidoglycan-N-acetylglucosamine deacetylase
MKRTLILITLIAINILSFAQKKVAITIDDLPNHTYMATDTKFLNVIDSLQLPVCVFFNGKLLHNQDSVQAQKIFNNWVSRSYVTIGNHTFSHPWYSESEFESFTADIEKNERVINEYISPFNKECKYFRFPFNDLGKDSAQNARIKQYLSNKNYVITPFTIESEDFAFNAIYENYLKNNETIKADSIGQLYVTKTMEFFSYFEELTKQLYGRPISHIYMCHDNMLNAKYFSTIVKNLNNNGYRFVSLDDAMKDDVYSSSDKFYKKWGISWIYRWVADASYRTELMKKEPDNLAVERLYLQLQTNK